MGKLFDELKRRKVFRVAAVYAVVAWVLIQVADIMLPALQLPDWTITFVTVLFILGFPIAIVLAWAYEITPDGLKLDSSISTAQTPTQNATDSLESSTKDETDIDPVTKPKRSANSKPCIAVLPFTDMSQEKNQEWFSEGITEEILNGLAKIPELKVIARTSSFALKGANLGVSEIGEKLNATHVLEGSIRSAGTKIRVSTQLGDASDGAQVWSDQYNDELTDVFGVQDKVAAAISNALNIHLLPVQQKAQLHQKVNPDAFKKYIQGRQYMNLVQLGPAIDLFEQAVELDKEFADPYGAMARAHNLYIFFNQASWNDKKEVVEHNLNRALEINPTQREALAVRASNLFFIDRSYQESINEFDRLVRLYPNDTTAVSLYRNVLSATFHPDLAIRAANRMVELDPLSPQAINYRGGVFLYQGKFDEARRDFEEATGLGAKIAQSHANLAFLLNDSDGVDKHLDAIKDQLGESASLGYKARSAYLRGDTEGVKAALSKIDSSEYVSHFEKSVHCFLKGDRDGFFEEYDNAIKSSEFFPFLRIHYASGLNKFDPDLVTDQKYQALLKDAGLDADSISKIVVPELPF